MNKLSLSCLRCRVLYHHSMVVHRNSRLAPFLVRTTTTTTTTSTTSPSPFPLPSVVSTLPSKLSSILPPSSPPESATSSLPELTKVWYELQGECRTFSTALAATCGPSHRVEGGVSLPQWHARLHAAFLSFYDACLRFGTTLHPAVLGGDGGGQQGAWETYTASPRSGLPDPFSLDRQVATQVGVLATAALELGVAHGCPPDAGSSARLMTLAGLRSTTSALFVLNTLAKTGSVPGESLEGMLRVCLRHGGQPQVALAVMYAMDTSGKVPGETELMALVNAMDDGEGEGGEEGGEGVGEREGLEDERGEGKWGGGNKSEEESHARALVLNHAYGLVRAEASEALQQYMKTNEAVQGLVGLKSGDEEEEEDDDEEDEEDEEGEGEGEGEGEDGGENVDEKDPDVVGVGVTKPEGDGASGGSGREGESDGGGAPADGDTSGGAGGGVERRGGGGTGSVSGFDSGGGGSSGNEEDSESSYSSESSAEESEGEEGLGSSTSTTTPSSSSTSTSSASDSAEEESKLLEDAAWWKRATSFLLNSAPPEGYTPAQFQGLVHALRSVKDANTGRSGTLDLELMGETIAAFKATTEAAALGSSSPSSPSSQGGMGGKGGEGEWINNARGYALAKEEWCEARVGRVVTAARAYLAAGSATPNPLLGESEDPRCWALLQAAARDPRVGEALIEGVRARAAGGLRAGLFHVETGATAFWGEEGAGKGDNAPFTLPSPASNATVASTLPPTPPPQPHPWPESFPPLVRKQLVLALFGAAWRRVGG